LRSGHFLRLRRLLSTGGPTAVLDTGLVGRLGSKGVGGKRLYLSMSVFLVLLVCIVYILARARASRGILSSNISHLTDYSLHY
jgi:hypothetical protein